MLSVLRTSEIKNKPRGLFRTKPKKRPAQAPASRQAPAAAQAESLLPSRPAASPAPALAALGSGVFGTQAVLVYRGVPRRHAPGSSAEHRTASSATAAAGAAATRTSPRERTRKRCQQLRPRRTAAHRSRPPPPPMPASAPPHPVSKLADVLPDLPGAAGGPPPLPPPPPRAPPQPQMAAAAAAAPTAREPGDGSRACASRRSSAADADAAGAPACRRSQDGAHAAAAPARDWPADQPRPITGQPPHASWRHRSWPPAPRTNGAPPPANGPAPAAAAPPPPTPPRPAPDFTNLPPAIAESLARLAGSLPRKPN